VGGAAPARWPDDGAGTLAHTPTKSACGKFAVWAHLMSNNMEAS